MPRLLILAALLAALALPALAQDLEVRVFQLNNRMPTATVEAVRVAMSPAGTVVPDDRTNTLIVKDTPEALARVAALLERLDVPAPQVRVHVAFAGGAARSGAGGAVAWNTGTGRVAGSASAGTGSSSVAADQNLLVMSGEEARIVVGRDIVQVQPYWILANNYGLIPPGVIFRQVSTGFAVQPRAVGEAITLTLTPWVSYDGPAGPGDIRFAESATTVSLRSGDSVVISTGSARDERAGAVFNAILGGNNQGLVTGAGGTSSGAEAMTMVVTAKVEPDWSTKD